MLCNANGLIDMRHWSRFDLLMEIIKIEECNQEYSSYMLELERWLTYEVRKALNQKQAKMDNIEQSKQLEEAKDLRKRLAIQKMLSRQFW